MRAGAITVETVALATLLSATLRRDVVTTTAPQRADSAAEASIRSLPAAQHPSPRTSRRRRAQADDAEMWARDSCETLLDTGPPLWWPPDLPDAAPPDAAPPDAAPPDAAPPPAPTEYLPFCSLVMLRSLAVDDPTARRAVLVADTRRWIDDNNACRAASGDEVTSSREGLAAPSVGATFVPHELRLMDGADNLSEGVPPAPPNDRRRRRRLHVRTYVDQILARKAEARMRCCHGIGARDRTCQAIFDRTRVLPCIPRRADEGFGDCVRGAFYTTIHHPAWDGAILRSGLATAIARGQTQIGRITVAPLVLPDGSPYDNDFVVRHELGHLCSDALRHSMMLSGMGEAQDELYESQSLASQAEGDRSRRCALTPPAETVYRQLWRDLGIEEASYRCLADAIERLSCADRCPRFLMEEAFADWFAMQLTPLPERVPQIFPNACFSMQDAQHLFFGTVLACLARSPAAQTYLEESLQCRHAASPAAPRSAAPPAR